MPPDAGGALARAGPWAGSSGACRGSCERWTESSRAGPGSRRYCRSPSLATARVAVRTVGRGRAGGRAGGPKLGGSPPEGPAGAEEGWRRGRETACSSGTRGPAGQVRRGRGRRCGMGGGGLAAANLRRGRAWGRSGSGTIREGQVLAGTGAGQSGCKQGERAAEKTGRERRGDVGGGGGPLLAARRRRL